MTRVNLFFLFLAIFVAPSAFSQTTIFFQGFEGSACNDTWPISGTWERNDQGGVSVNNKRTGTYSARIGRGTGGAGAPSVSNGPATLTMSSINLTGYTGVVVKLYTSTASSFGGSGHGTGTGLDANEQATVQFRINGGSWTTYDQVSGSSNYVYSWTTNPIGSGGCGYTMANPLLYNVPAGTTTLEMRIYSGGTCASTGSNYDRADEGVYIDDIEVTTTGTVSSVNWTGNSSTDWFCKANWSPAVVPTSAMNVTITQAASNNCVVSGTGAAVCNNLTVSSNNGTNRTLTVQNTASLNCTGNVALNKTAGSGSLKLTLANSAVFTCANLSMTGTSSGSENAQFENEVNTTTATVNGHLNINNGGVLDLTNSPNYGTLNLKGNYTNNGLETDFKQSGSYLRFTGTGDQTISTSGFTEVYSNMVVNKTSGVVILNNELEIENNLTFTNGIVNTSATGLLVIKDVATVNSMSNASHVNGPVRKVGDNTFTFPVGDAGNYQPLSISAPGSATDHFTAEYFADDADPLYDRSLKDPSLDHISTCEYWILDRTNGSSDVSVTLNWDAGSCGITVLPGLAVARWDGSLWQNHGNGGTTGTTASGSIVTAGAVTSFSPFTLASLTTENPLPVQLLMFDASLANGMVHTSWLTASEQNTLFHIVERSGDGIDFTETGRLNAAGNSNRTLQYELNDQWPLSGTSYYRLKTQDKDGSVSYSNVVPVKENGRNDEHVIIANNSAVPVIKAKSGVNLRLFTANGQLVFDQPLTPGNHLVLDQLPNGMYLLQVTVDGHTQIEKVAVAK